MKISQMHLLGMVAVIAMIAMYTMSVAPQSNNFDLSKLTMTGNFVSVGASIGKAVGDNAAITGALTAVTNYDSYRGNLNLNDVPSESSRRLIAESWERSQKEDYYGTKRSSRFCVDSHMNTKGYAFGDRFRIAAQEFPDGDIELFKLLKSSNSKINSLPTWHDSSFNPMQSFDRKQGAKLIGFHCALRQFERENHFQKDACKKVIDTLNRATYSCAIGRQKAEQFMEGFAMGQEWVSAR